MKIEPKIESQAQPKKGKGEKSPQLLFEGLVVAFALTNYFGG